jgi:hypothetical protein
VILLIAAILTLGWLTAQGCMSVVNSAAVRERSQIEQQMHTAMEQVAEQYVLVPVKQELSEYSRFCTALRTARQ